QRTAILDIGHPSFIAKLETAVELAQLVLQISQCNINVDPHRFGFPRL
ncbi:hypothetical protein A2U01_0082332, partial [Trifolium medium]|nr:hypothetical protein [Trifolium medium]